MILWFFYGSFMVLLCSDIYIKCHFEMVALTSAKIICEIIKYVINVTHKS